MTPRARRARLIGGLALLLLVAWISGRFEPTIPRESASEKPASPAAPVSEARWEGRWEFDYTLTRLEGVSEDSSGFRVGSTIRRVWDVTPECSSGPCNAAISATDPDMPASDPIPATVTYDNGVYRTSQTFPPIHTQRCRGADGKELEASFEATNLVEVRPSRAERSSGGAVVVELTATKSTTFNPTGEAATAGGSCDLKAAVWEGTVVPAG